MADDAGDAARLAEGIDLAAENIEAELPRVIGRRQVVVRTVIQQTAARIAATLRTYAVDVSLGGDERDQALPQHFSSASVSAAWGRWEDLARTEPHSIVQRFIK